MLSVKHCHEEDLRETRRLCSALWFLSRLLYLRCSLYGRLGKPQSSEGRPVMSPSSRIPFDTVILLIMLVSVVCTLETDCSGSSDVGAATLLTPPPPPRPHWSRYPILLLACYLGCSREVQGIAVALRGHRSGTWRRRGAPTHDNEHIHRLGGGGGFKRVVRD
jgi:hypothetical protein